MDTENNWDFPEWVNQSKRKVTVVPEVPEGMGICDFCDWYIPREEGHSVLGSGFLWICNDDHACHQRMDRN